LYNAAGAGRTDVVKLLLQYGARLNLPDSAPRHNVLARAALSGSKGRIAVVRILLDAGADPNAELYRSDGTPDEPLLIQAVFLNTRSAEMVRLLLSAGVNPQAKNARGQNTLAVLEWYKKNMDIALALLDGGVSATDSSIYKTHKRTLLHWAVSVDNQALFDAALKAGVDVNQRDGEKVSPLLIAVRRGKPDFVRALLKAGAPINESVAYSGMRFFDYTRTYEGRDDLLAEAVGAGNAEVIQILIAAGVNLDTAGNNYDFSAPLHIAAKKKRHDIAKILLDAKSNPDPVDRNERTPLHLAVLGKDSAMVKLLLQAGADPQRQDKEGKSVLDYSARHATGTDIPALLQQSGKK
jgi:ankyrin repeat protein